MGPERRRFPVKTRQKPPLSLAGQRLVGPSNRPGWLGGVGRIGRLPGLAGLIGRLSWAGLVGPIGRLGWPVGSITWTGRGALPLLRRASGGTFRPRPTQGGLGNATDAAAPFARMSRRTPIHPSPSEPIRAEHVPL